MTDPNLIQAIDKVADARITGGGCGEGKVARLFARKDAGRRQI